MTNPEAGRNPDLLTGLIIGSKSLFAYSERAFFKYIILKVVICICAWTKVNYIIFERKNMDILVGNDVLDGGKEI